MICLRLLCIRHVVYALEVFFLLFSFICICIASSTCTCTHVHVHACISIIQYMILHEKYNVSADISFGCENCMLRLYHLLHWPSISCMYMYLYVHVYMYNVYTCMYMYMYMQLSYGSGPVTFSVQGIIKYISDKLFNIHYILCICTCT